jgi:hypothetical protein
VHAAYDSESVEKFWRILLSVDSVFQQFRSRFVGKSSPVHFFWGSFDLAVTRFSGRRGPERPGAHAMTREAYSHEVSSVGFWPGSGEIMEAAFYSYTQPEPQGFKQARVRPEAAFYSTQPGEFLLMYDDRSKGQVTQRLVTRLLPKHLRGRCYSWQLGSRWIGAGGGVTKGESSMAAECAHLNRIKLHQFR